jgi:hypothetical protein
MINALARLGGMVPGELPKGLQAMGITSGVGKLFSSHGVPWAARATATSGLTSCSSPRRTARRRRAC